MLPNKRLLSLLSVLVGVTSYTFSHTAHAAAPRQNEERVGGRAYAQISPGAFALVIDENRFSRDARWAWPWSLGAGWMFVRDSAFKASIGAAFEHRVFVLDHVTPHGLQAVVESRIGAGNHRVWAYGLLGVGAAAVIVNWDGQVTDDFYGVVGQFGGGVQGLVGRRFFIGGELDFDVGYYFSARSELQIWDPFYYHTMSAELVFGWYF